MSRIGSIGSLGTDQLRALNRIGQLGRAISENQTRLTTLKRINSAKDDPSGLVHASILERELAAAEKSSQGVTRASALLSTADSAATEIVTQLQSARTLVIAAAGGTLSAAEKAANQIEIDTILQSVNNLARTEFSGRQLLTGASGFTVSGADNSTVLDVDVLSKNTTGDLTVNVEVTSTATQATNDYQGGTLSADATLIVTGPDGATTISLSNGDDTQAITDAFNAATYLTGVTATRVDANQVDFATADYGSNATIAVQVTEGTFNLTTSGTVTGTDAVATVNGQSYTGDGATFNVNTSQYALSLELSPTASGTLTPFTVSGDGLQFIVGTSASSTASIGLPSFMTSSLGGPTGSLDSIGSGGANSIVADKPAEALRILDDAISDVTRGQAVIGSFQKYTLDSSSRVLAKTTENLASALSAIQDTDIALETAKLTNNQLLQQSAFQALSITSFRNQDLLGLLQRTATLF
jgi:flagellin